LRQSRSAQFNYAAEVANAIGSTIRRASTSQRTTIPRLLGSPVIRHYPPVMYKRPEWVHGLGAATNDNVRQLWLFGSRGRGDDVSLGVIVSGEDADGRVRREGILLWARE
jgi:hypothetical protein